MTLTLYGVMGSQPVRACAWLLELKGIPYDFVEVIPGGRKESEPWGTRSKSYLSMAPSGTVPALKDTDVADDFVLFESNAIMLYLCEKFQWTDVYPSDAAGRGKVNQWLNWHHGNSRVFTIALFVPYFRQDIKFTPEVQRNYERTVSAVAKLLERHLRGSPFLAGDAATIADIAVYEDVGQCGSEWCDLFDFHDFPAIHAWTQRMEALPKFKETHGIFPVMRKFIDKQRAKAKL